ncbi:MAG TPA: lipoyl(octanoyl) transferase, partial [Candidatus Omnitrophica bacterium]|nr:lipoyl(octanoyl) transferase [Candidatus Omnitrophota bacterium]
METLCIQSEIKFWYLGKVDFLTAYHIQQELASEKISNPCCCDFILGVIHKPCITVGRMGKSTDIKSQDFPIYFTDRGGKVTYHGPGQLVIYVIMNIKPLGVKGYLDFLEKNIVRLLTRLGIPENAIVTNLRGRGIWVNGKKVCSLGIGIRKWISYHGVSINLDKRVHQGFRAI